MVCIYVCTGALLQKLSLVWFWEWKDVIVAPEKELFEAEKVEDEDEDEEDICEGDVKKGIEELKIEKEMA